jgi:hypothetical protein
MVVLCRLDKRVNEFANELKCERANALLNEPDNGLEKKPANEQENRLTKAGAAAQCVVRS